MQCSFAGIRLSLPESMAEQVAITRAGTDLWVCFSDRNRQVGIQFPKREERNAQSLRQAMLPIPDGISDWTSPRLMKEICDCSSSDFSWRQSTRQLRRHIWAITQRREQSLDINHLTSYTFRVTSDCEWILLSCDPVTVDDKRRLRSIMIWEDPDSQANGQLHFGDAAQREVGWIPLVAKSFCFTSFREPENPARQLADQTDSEILSAIQMDRGSEWNGEK